MASGSQWIQGARPRTLPNAIAPVLAGTGAAIWLGGAVWWKAVLALVVSVAFVVGVNFANDYSDGIRGTDDERVGPMRLVGSGAASPQAVRTAAFATLAVASIAGLILSLTSAWWLVFVGVACIAGAWFYTGGTRPYGYSGFGEVAVFVFFGLVGVLGAQFTQAGRIDWVGVVNAVAVGCFSSAVLTTNNLRDIPSDSVTGKTTLAVRLGARTTRLLHTALVTIPSALSVVLVVATPWALLGLLATPLAWQAGTPVRSGAQGPDLIPALARTGVAMVAWSVLTTVGLALGRYL